jgi:CheY-like chemotaxis protein
MLAQRPHLQVLTESDGQRGLDLIRRHQPALVLTDITLPTIDGEQILRILKSSPETAQIPVVMLSGDVTPETRERTHQAGARAFLDKPINMRTLLDLIDELLDPATT